TRGGFKIINQNGTVHHVDAQSTFGTGDAHLIAQLFLQVTNASPVSAFEPSDERQQRLATLRGIGPRDTLEALLGVQMVAVHNLGMEFLARAAISIGRNEVGLDLNLNRATKLLNLFRTQAEILQRQRERSAGGQQQVHVHVRAKAGAGGSSNLVNKMEV